MRWKTSLSLAASSALLAGCSSGHYRPVERERVVVYDRPVYQPAPDNRVVVEQGPVQVTEVVAGPEVEVREFHEQLSPYGRWVNVGAYGECWQPSDVDRDWRPYTRGYWAHSRYGWTWVSDERFGWATYHYGRWAFTEEFGWVWVPARTWGPAWVAWRSGDGYCGWAPLPPAREEVVVVTSREYDDIPADRFTFCEERYIGEPRVRDHFVPVRSNVTIINRTTNITNITIVNNRVISHGLDVHEVERASGRRVSDVRVQQVSSFNDLRARHDQDWQRYHPEAARHEALHEEHVAEHDALHQEHVDEHNTLHQVHVDEHNANVAAHDAAHEAHVEQHDVAHETRLTAEQAARQKRLDEENASRGRRVAEQKVVEDKHAAEQKAAEDKTRAEHDAHVEAHDEAHEKHVSEHDAAAAKHATEQEQKAAAQDAAREKRLTAEAAAKAKQDAARDKRAADQKNPKDKAASDKDPKQQ
ncbi:MAG TPA: DUF6600 domain-containing protein [Tepidisphaeraceae bacterium]|jgi:hypothetical protein|nr:DUF6600 domain-containing protein [Tepidisphaeraceae bacterium]